MQNQLAPMGLLPSLRTFLSLLWGQQRPFCLLLQRVKNPRNGAPTILEDLLVTTLGATTTFLLIIAKSRKPKMGSFASQLFQEGEHSPKRCFDQGQTCVPRCKEIFVQVPFVANLFLF